MPRKRGRPRVPIEKHVKFRTVGARLEVGVADQFAAWCKARGTTAHKEIKRLIMDLLNS